MEKSANSNNWEMIKILKNKYGIEKNKRKKYNNTVQVYSPILLRIHEIDNSEIYSCIVIIIAFFFLLVGTILFIQHSSTSINRRVYLFSRTVKSVFGGHTT